MLQEEKSLVTPEQARHARHLAIARRLGCLVEEHAEPVTIGEASFTSSVVHATDNLQAIHLLNALAGDDADQDEEIIQIAGGFVAQQIREHRSDEWLARALQNYVRANVAFVTEPGEAFRSASLTLRLGAGDCDDSARLLVALALACDLEARVSPVYDEEGEISHVAAQIYLTGIHERFYLTDPSRFSGGAWEWAETTFDAEFGEEPRAAAKRLGILRADLA